MLEVWERAVRATHDFLDDPKILELRPAVVEVLASNTLQWWVIEVGDGLAGFLGIVDASVEALFIEPIHHRRGLGRMLMTHAQQLSAGKPLSVDVNEANQSALRFYRQLGFAVIGRSSTDGEGRPYPLLHMKRPAPVADTFRAPTEQ